MSSCGSNTYGIHKESHDRVHIESAENGLKCNCVCPACQADLIARNNGKKRAPHFAHASGHACVWASETDVHLMAKQILSEKKWVCFPSYHGKIYKKDYARQDFESVVCEPFISGKRPDCVGIWKDEKGKKIEIWVEIKVTHSVEEQKLELIKKLGITCIEIDLKQYANLHELTEDFEDAVLVYAERVWLNAPFLENIDNRKIEKENVARKKRNEELRISVARKLKNMFDVEEKFKVPIPCLNVCHHQKECVCIGAKDCTEHGQRMVDMKKFYDRCDILPSNVNNRVIRMQNSRDRYEPLYIAVYGEGEKFPNNVSNDKVLAVQMMSSYDTQLLFQIEDDSYSSYHMGYCPYEYDYENEYYPNEVMPVRWYYNFVEKEEKTEFKHMAQMNLFVLYRSGKWFNKNVPCEDQFDTKTKGVFQKYFQILSSTTYNKDLYGIALAIEAGYAVKHCSICNYYRQFPMEKIGWCTKPEVGSKIECWSALSCAYFERNDALIQKVKEDQRYLYKSI